MYMHVLWMSVHAASQCSQSAVLFPENLPKCQTGNERIIIEKFLAEGRVLARKTVMPDISDLVSSGDSSHAFSRNARIGISTKYRFQRQTNVVRTSSIYRVWAPMGLRLLPSKGSCHGI